MAVSPFERTGVLVLVWTEDERGLRAGIGSTVELDSDPAQTAAATSVDEIRAIVAEFVTPFLQPFLAERDVALTGRLTRTARASLGSPPGSSILPPDVPPLLRSRRRWTGSVLLELLVQAGDHREVLGSELVLPAVIQGPPVEAARSRAEAGGGTLSLTP